MSVALIACGLFALALPGFRGAPLWRGDPVWFATLNVVAIVLGLAAVTSGLTVSVVVGMVHLAAGASLWSYDGHLAPGGFAASVVSAALLITLASRVAGAIARARLAACHVGAEDGLGQHFSHDDHEVVVVPTDRIVAYAVERPRRQVVISEGLCSRVDHTVIGFVIDHERAHIRRGHRRFLLVAAATEAVFDRVPWIVRSTLALRLTVERVADEDAAGTNMAHRRRAVAGLRSLSQEDGESASEALAFRARLLAKPARGPSRIEAVAGSGLASVALVVVWLATHTTGDIPALLALLRG